MNDDSGDFRRNGKLTAEQSQVLLGQLLEAVKGLRRESNEQAATVARIGAKIEEFERLMHGGRGVLIGMGLASLGLGAIAHKFIDYMWPT